MKKRTVSLLMTCCLLATVTPVVTMAEEQQAVENQQTTETQQTTDAKKTTETQQSAGKKEAEENQSIAEKQQNVETQQDAEKQALSEKSKTAVYAEKSVDVATDKEFESALKDDSITTINITGDIKYTEGIDTDKTIIVKNGATFTWRVYRDTFHIGELNIEAGSTFAVNPFDFMSQAIISGLVTNNGDIQVTSTKGYCFWNAQTSGSGKFSLASESTMIRYGTVPDTMLNSLKLGTDYFINVLADLSKEATVSLPAEMQTGDTITPTFTNIIDRVDLAKVFKFKWTNGSSFERYNGAVSPTLTEAGTLNLSVSMQKGYKMQQLNIGNGSIDAKGTVKKKLLDVVYVDMPNGNNSNMGDTSASAVASISTAMDNVAEGGTIILSGDYTGTYVFFEKNVTIKSAEGHTYNFSPDKVYISKEGVTATLENLNCNNLLVTGYDVTGNIIFDHCIGSIEGISQNIKNVVVQDCNLSGTIQADEKLTLKDSTISGRIWTKDLEASGKNVLIPVKNAPNRIMGEATITDPITIQVPTENLAKGFQVFQVPTENTSVLPMVRLAYTKDGLFKLKHLKLPNGTSYIIVSQRVQSGGELIVANEPFIGNAVENSHADIKNDDCMVQNVEWSGFTNVTENKWSTGDEPELIVTLKETNRDGTKEKHFDETFDVTKIKVYSRKNTEEYLNSDVQIVVKEGQGLSTDGETFTFTVVYPKVERMEQEIVTDLTDRTAVCGEKLAPRSVTAKGTVSYESSNPTVATVNSQTGEVTALNQGTVDIIIRAEQTDLYKEAEVRYHLTIDHAPVNAPQINNNLTYEGTAQKLITPGATTEGTFWYKVGDGEWTTEIPTATNAGKYEISYKVVREEGHGESDVQQMEVMIASKSIKNANTKVILGKSLKYTGKSQTQTIEKITVDGMEIPADSYEVTGNTATEPGTYEMTITAKEGSNFTGTITCKYSIAEKDKDDTGNNGDKNKDDTKKDDTKKDDTKKDDTKNKDDNKKQVKNTQNNKDNQNKSTTKQVSKDQKETAVKTGDTAHAFGYLLALEGALVVSLATLLISRKRRHR